MTDPDLFLLELTAQDLRACQAAVEREARRMRRPLMTAQEVLAGVAAVVPTFANSLHQTMLDSVEATSDAPTTSQSRSRTVRCRTTRTHLT